jgi:hypothetical protein
VAVGAGRRVVGVDLAPHGGELVADCVEELSGPVVGAQLGVVLRGVEVVGCDEVGGHDGATDQAGDRRVEAGVGHQEVLGGARDCRAVTGVDQDGEAA